MEQCDEAKRRSGSSASAWRLTLNPAELAARQELYNGFGNGLALAFELALTPAIFGLIGYGLDRWLGLLPVLTIVFVLLAVAGLSVRQFAAYTENMKVHETKGPWARRPIGSDGARRPIGSDGPRRPTLTPSLAATRTETLATATIFRGPAGRQRRRHAGQKVAS